MYEEFLEDITVAGAPLAPSRKAYRMDGNDPDPDMRKKVGLGTCNCCDYFTFGTRNAVILIEETRLAEQIAHLKQKYSYLNSTDRDNHVIECILRENRLKIYGSLLILCRLFYGETDAPATPITSEGKYSFWLVASVGNLTDDVIAIDHVRDQIFHDLIGGLTDDLKGVLGSAVMDSVEIVPAEALANKLDAAIG